MDSASSWLLEPISEDAPCGENLEDTQLLSSFDGYRVFGQMSPPSGETTDWRELRDAAEDALRKSKDFRLLANFAVARLHLEGLAKFCHTLAVAPAWLEAFPDHVYPLIDDDAILRRNALNNFADRMAVIDAVRRTPFVRHPMIGAFSLRDLEFAKGLVTAPEGEEGSTATEGQIQGALSAIDEEELQASTEAFATGVEAAERIEALMRDTHGFEGTPELSPLLAQLKQIHGLFAGQLATRSASAQGDAADGSSSEGAGGAGVIGVGSIRSRDDALRALDAVSEFFRKNEPSSPVPMVVDRAKRLMSLNFLEVLKDLAPGGLEEAKVVGGVRDEE